MVYSIIFVVSFIAIFWPFDKDRFVMVFNNVVCVLCGFIYYTILFIEWLINLFIYYANNNSEMMAVNEWLDEYVARGVARGVALPLNP